MAWAHVGTSAVNSTTASGTGTVTYTGVTAGHMLLVCISNVGTSSVSSIADSGSNTWVLANNENSSNIDNTMYYSLITTGGNLTVTATMSGTTAIVTMTADEYSFTPGTLSLGNVATNTDTASTGWTTGSLAFTKTCLVVGSVSTNNPAATDTWTTPMIARNGVAEVPGTSFGLFVADALNTVATPINPSGTWGTGGTNYCSSGAVFLTTGDNLASGAASTTSSGNTIATVTVANAVGGLSGYTYQWYRSTTTGFTPGAGNIVAGATSQTLNDTGLTNGTTYFYKNVVTDAATTTAISNQISATPTASASFSVSPSTSANAQNVTYTLTGSGTSWTGGTTFSISGVTGASITSQSVVGQVGTVAVLLDNTHVGTLTFSDSTDAANATSAVTLAAPGVPASPSCTPGNTQNVIAWSVPVSGGLVATYTLLRGLTPGSETSFQTGLVTTSYTDTGLTNGTTYYYKIESVNATGTSSPTSEVSGTPATGSSLTLSQITEVVAVLARNITAPFPYENLGGVKVDSSNSIRIKATTDVANLGTNLVATTDGTNLYVTLNAGDASSGTG